MKQLYKQRIGVKFLKAIAVFIFEGISDRNPVRNHVARQYYCIASSGNFFAFLNFSNAKTKVLIVPVP